MTVPAPIRVCIVERHPIMRIGLRMLLAPQPEVQIVGEAEGRKGAFEVARRECPNLFVVDLHLGPESIADFLEELLIACDAKAIVLTDVSVEEQIHRAISAGATGLVYKNEPSEVLVRAIIKVHAGEVWLPRSMMASALSRFRAIRSNRKDDREKVKIATLTVREREIVALVASGMNRRTIAEKLFISNATVRNHLSSIFAKLEISSQFELVFYAQRHNFNK
jgi:two-component system nitrate/nitrite response regulator NarL